MTSNAAPLHSHSLKHWQEIKAQLKNMNDLRDNCEVLEEEESFDKDAEGSGKRDGRGGEAQWASMVATEMERSPGS